MKINDLAYLTLRVAAIYLFIMGIGHLVDLLQFSLPAYLQVMERGTTYGEVFLIVGVPVLLLLICGFLLWVLAPKLAKYLVPASAASAGISESGATAQTKNIEGFVLAVVGLILFILSFTGVVRGALNYFNMLSQDIEFNRLQYIYFLGEQAVRFVLGVILLVKAEGFALLLRKIRNAGLSKPE